MGSKNSKKEYSFVIEGLDGAGKSSILYYLKSQDKKASSSSILTVEITYLNYKGVNLNISKYSGKDKDKLRSTLTKLDGLIFVVDSTDRDKFEDAAKELDKLVHEDNMLDCKILILANKQDLNTASPPGEIVERLRCGELKGRDWLVQGCNIISGEGINDGFDWLIPASQDKKKK